jgi:hypothetical protein
VEKAKDVHDVSNSGTLDGTLAILARHAEATGWRRDSGLAKRWNRDGRVALELEEQDELGLTEEGPLAEAHDIRFVSFPILDRAVPQSLSATAALLAKVREALDNGKTWAFTAVKALAARLLLLEAC